MINFGATNLYKKFDEAQQQFIEDLVLYTSKRYKGPFHLWKYLVTKVDFTLVPHVLSFFLVLL